MKQMELREEYVDVLEEHGWRVSSYTDDGRVEIETETPAGEDFIVCVEVECFPEQVAMYAQDFDVDEHIAMWIEAKKNGDSNVPPARVLVHDTEEIEKMLYSLAEELYAADHPKSGSMDEPDHDNTNENQAKMRLIYICSPLRGDIEGNIRKAEKYCRLAVKKYPDVLPIAPHIYCTRFLDDTIPEEREAGLRMGLQLLDKCCELWYFGNPSEGMKGEIRYAKEHGIPALDGFEVLEDYLEEKHTEAVHGTLSIRETKGDLLQTDAQIIAHQVNCVGVMGAGVAKQIRSKILTGGQFQIYQELCQEWKEMLLGRCLICQRKDTLPGRYVANLFGENIPTGKRLDTDYGALARSFANLKKKAAALGACSIAIPGYIGCGLAGGDWEKVYNEILVPLFADGDISLTIVYRMDSIQRLWEEFGDVPMDPDTECLERSWHGFPEGTFREDIWRWFEETFQISVAEDLMFPSLGVDQITGTRKTETDPEKLMTGKTVRTLRGIFYITDMSREQMEAAGFGFHHAPEDGKYLIMTNGTQAYAIAANKGATCRGKSMEANRADKPQKYYFTFGSDPGFPYQNAYLVVEADSEVSAIEKFRRKFPDRSPNVYNASFCYSQEKWEELGCQKFYPNGPAEVIR